MASTLHDALAPQDFLYTLIVRSGQAVALTDQFSHQGFDVPALTWWRPEEWRRRFVDRSEFRIGDHIFTAVSRTRSKDPPANV